jgi:hypothetical protein
LPPLARWCAANIVTFKSIATIPEIGNDPNGLKFFPLSVRGNGFKTYPEREFMVNLPSFICMGGVSMVWKFNATSCAPTFQKICGL